MIGYTIGTGKWAAGAEMARARMERMTGIDCRILPDHFTDGLPHPSWAKCRILEHAKDDVMIFDADLFCMKPWSPEDMLGDADVAVVAHQPNTLTVAECNLYGIPKERYFNAGLVLCRYNRGMREMWERVLGYHPNYGSWMEQTALVKVVHALPPHLVRYMPYAYNRLVGSGKVAVTIPQLHDMHQVNLHFAGRKDPEVLVKIYNQLATYSPQGGHHDHA